MAKLCRFATALINTPSMRSVPVSRILNVDTLYKSMLPIARKNHGKSLGWFTARSIRKVEPNESSCGVASAPVLTH
jgi:hypothetical protein